MAELPEIGEVVVVEGQSDRAQVQKAVRADILVTGGSRIHQDVFDRLKRAVATRGIIILTDPDYAGGQIRRQITARFPDALQAYVARAEATQAGDVGVENADPALIAKVLTQVRKPGARRPPIEFTQDDLQAACLCGQAGAARRRERLGAILGVGYANGKAFLARLNALGVTRSEWQAACAKLEAESRD